MRITLVVGAGVIFMATAPTVCLAEGATAAGSPAISDVTGDRLEEIVVTAQRRRQNLQDVPIAVTAVTGAQLASAGIRESGDLKIMAPSFDMPHSAGYSSPRIRGVGAAAFGATFENSVATYVDGVYYAAAPTALMSFNSVSQVEILRGPQGTLFGRNATGGLIQVTTRDPQQHLEGQARIGYGSYDTAEASFYMGGGLGEKVAADLALAGTWQGEGYGENKFNGDDVNQIEDQLAMRSKWLVGLGESAKLRVIVDYALTEGNGHTSTPNAPGTVPLFGPAFTGDEWDLAVDFEPRDEYTSGGASAQFDVPLAWGDFTSITAYRQSKADLAFDADLTTGQFEDISLIDRERQFTQEFQLRSPDSGDSDWVVGLFLFDAKGEYDPSQVTLGGPLVAPLETIQIFSAQSTLSYAAYGQATFGIATETRLTVGLRYTNEERELDGRMFGFLSGGIPIGNLVPPIDAEKVSFERVTWRLSLDHRFNDSTLGYVSYNRGFKSGGFNPGVPTDAPFEPEILDAYEVGLKVELADGRVRINSSLFYYDYQKIQVSRFVLGQISYYNGAEAELYGLDVDMSAVLGEHLTLTAGLAVLHDEFADFPNADFYTQLPTGGALISTGDATGNRLPYASRTTASLAANYRIPFSAGDLELDAAYYYNDGWFAQPDNFLQQPSYQLINCAASFVFPGDRYVVRAWVRNAGDEAYATTINASAISSLIQYAPPRTYGASFEVRF